MFEPMKRLPPDWGMGRTITLKAAQQQRFLLFYRLSPLEMSEVKMQVREILRLGLIEPNKSSYGPPVLFVKRKA